MTAPQKLGACDTANVTPEPAPPAADNGFPAGRWRLIVALFAVVVLVVLAIVKLYVPQIERDAYTSLEVAARLKAQQVESWLVERHSDGKVLASDAEFIERIADIRRKADPKKAALIRRRLDIVSAGYGYSAAQLLDPQGNVIAASAPDHQISAQTLAMLPQAFARDAIVQSDFYLDAADGEAALNFVVPLQRTVAGKRQPVAAVVLRAAPSASIFHLILGWPSASGSGETLLVRGEGDSVVYLNELRHVGNSALRIRQPLADPTLPAANAVRTGKPGATRGRDYRGVDVLAAYRPVAGTDWHLIAKIDADEVMAPLWQLVAWVGLVALAATLAIGLMLRRLWSQQRRLHALAAHAAQTQALRESEARLRAVTETARDAIVTVDARGDIVGWNSAATRMFGFATGEILGQSLTRIIPERFHPSAMKSFLRMMDGDPERMDGSVAELLARRRDDSEFLMERSVALWETGAGRFYTCTMRDITESKRQEEETRRLLVENQTILGNALVGIVYLKQRRIVSCNRRFEELFHFGPGELIGESTEGLYETRETYLDVGARGYSALAEAKSFSEEVRLRHKDGSMFWGALTGCAIDPARPNDGSIWIYADISERRRAEEESVKLRQALEQHQANLENLVLQRTAELNEALAAAKLADKSKDEFLANITHELRTPLAAVIGFSSLARPLCTDPRQSDYLDKVNTAGKTLAGVIDDLLDLSKIVAGRMEFENRPFSLRQLVVRSHSVISFRAREKGLELIERIDEDVPDALLGDSLRVEQILLNLLSNAVKFTDAGRIELRVAVLAREAQRLCLAIEVEDSGIGIGKEGIALLFKPFSQADASMTRKFGGTGLGLAICKRLAEMMDGDIGVTSREGIGTTFRVRLWLGLDETGGAATATERQRQSARVHYRDARVLVVDDQPFNRDVVAGLLTAVGITPHLAGNGQEALDVLALGGKRFDLILMDIQMPIVDGLTATRVIRKLGGFADLPIIAMTAHTMAHEKEKGVAAGMNDHIGKPFDEAGFYDTLARWIQPAKQHRPAAAEPRPAADGGGLPLLAGVDTRAGLALLLGDEARYRHWLIDFAAEAPVALKRIRQALASGTIDAASMAAHTLKGRMGLLGMKALHGIAAELETAIDTSAPADALLTDLDHGVAVVCAEIRQGLGAAPEPAPAACAAPDEPPRGPPPDSVTRLIDRLRAGDSDCDLLLGGCLAELKDTAWAPHLRQALVHIENFDYAAAIGRLSGDRQTQAQET